MWAPTCEPPSDIQQQSFKKEKIPQNEEVKILL